MNSLGANTYGDIFIQSTMADLNLPTCGQTCYVKCSCNEANGWYANEPSSGTYVTATTKNKYIENNSTLACHKAKGCPADYFEDVPDSNYFVYDTKTLSSGKKCYKAKAKYTQKRFGDYSSEGIQSTRTPTTYHGIEGVQYGSPSCTNGFLDNGKYYTNYTSSSQTVRSDWNARKEGCIVTFIRYSYDAAEGLKDNLCCIKDDCPSGYYSSVPNSTYFETSSSTANGVTCYKVTGCKSPYSTSGSTAVATYSPQNYTCYESYYSIKIVYLTCLNGYWDASISTTDICSIYISDDLPGGEYASMEIAGDHPSTSPNHAVLKSIANLTLSYIQQSSKYVDANLYTTSATSGGQILSLETSGEAYSSNQDQTWTNILPNFLDATIQPGTTKLGNGKYQVNGKTYQITTTVRPKHAHTCSEKHQKYLYECTFQESQASYCCKDNSSAVKCNEISATRQTNNCILYGSREP